MEIKFILPPPELNTRSLLQIQYLNKIHTAPFRKSASSLALLSLYSSCAVWRFGVPYLIFILISAIAKNIKIFTTKIIEYIINPKHLCITLLGLSICKLSFLSSLRIVPINSIIGIITTNNIDIGINTYIIKIK